MCASNDTRTHPYLFELPWVFPSRYHSARARALIDANTLGAVYTGSHLVKTTWGRACSKNDSRSIGRWRILQLHPGACSVAVAWVACRGKRLFLMCPEDLYLSPTDDHFAPSKITRSNKNGEYSVLAMPCTTTFKPI